MCSENQDEVLNRSAGHKPDPCNSVDVFSLAFRREHKELQKSSETETVTETEFPLHLGQDQGESGVYIVRQDGLGPGLQVSVLLHRVGLDACILDMNIKCHCVCVSSLELVLSIAPLCYFVLKIYLITESDCGTSATFFCRLICVCAAAPLKTVMALSHFQW